MRMLVFSCFLGAGAFNVLAQTPVATGTVTPNVGIAAPAFKPVSLVSLPKDDPHRGFLKHLTIESFGYGPGPLEPGFQFSPGYTAALFNSHGLECPGCVIGPVNRAKFTLPPFGAKATLKVWDGRVEFSSGFAALEAWKPDGTFEPRGLSLYSSSYGDAWFAQMEASWRIALDPTKHVWFGATGRHLSNFGGGLRKWNTFSGEATFVFGH
jgi:hypothetical protein